MAEKQQSMTVQEALDLGVKQHQTGHLDQAQNIYKQILQLQPNQPVALHLLGVSAHQKGNNVLAVDLISKAIEFEPNYSEAHSNLSLALSALGKTHDAIESCKHALSINPNYAEAHNNLGLALESLAKPVDAEKSYQKAVELKPNYGIAHNNLGNVLQDLGRMEEAIESYQKAIDADPEYADAHNNMGNALREIGKLDEALKCYRKSLKIDQRSTHAHGNLGDTLKDITYHKIHLGKTNTSSTDVDAEFSSDLQEAWEEVLTCADKALQIRANDTQALALKTSALIGLNRLNEWRGLCNFERFIETKIIDVPDGYKDLKAFNDALFARCAEDPNLSYEQGGKSIRKGQRINALQLDSSPSPVASLLNAANHAVHHYKSNHPEDEKHPYLAQTPATWHLTAWGSILEKQGHHEPHIHRSGWVSGVYYGILPASTKTGDDAGQGYIEFGRPSNHIQSKNDPDFHLLKPDEGLLVLFPSYFYHQTIPFESDEIRFTIAFDVIPEF